MCLVSVPFISMEHIIKPKQKEKKLSSEEKHRVPLFILIKPTLQPGVKKRIGLPASQSRQKTETERCTLGAVVHVKLRLGSWRRRDSSMFSSIFFTRFHFIVVGRLPSSPICNPTSHLLFHYFSISLPSVSTETIKMFLITHSWRSLHTKNCVKTIKAFL